MTKADIVNEISKVTGVDKESALAVVEAFMDSIETSVSNNENVYLRGFGSFIVKRRAPKTARNISKKESIQIDERYIPAFKPSRKFQEKLDKNKDIFHVK